MTRPVAGLLAILASGALAMEPPEAIEADKRRASVHAVLHVERLQVAEPSRTGGLDICRAEGRVLQVRRGRLTPGDPLVVTRLPCWDATREMEPPGLHRVYYNDGKPGRLEVWGRIEDDGLLAYTFEASEPLAAIDQVRDAFGTADVADAAQRAGLTAKVRDDRVAILTLPRSLCIDSREVHARYSPHLGLTPVHPERPLPALWYADYLSGVVRLSFGFEMTEHHNLDGCLREVILAPYGVDSIGTATMDPDGTIHLRLRAETGPTVGDALLRYSPGHAEYDAILRHLGGLRPGEEKPVPPFPR